MGWFDRFLGNFGYVRYSDSSQWYNISRSNATYLNGQDKLKIALNHPVISGCISIRADYLSKARFYIEEPNGDKNFDDPSLDFMKNPNPHQSGEDFLKQYEWFSTSYGWVYQIPYTNKLDGSVKHIYNLNPSQIEFPKKMGDSLIITQSDQRKYYSKEFIYQDVDNNKKIKFSDVIPYFDIANNVDCTETSSVTSPSRLDSIIREASNFISASDAENITLQTNGKQIFFGLNNKGNAINLPLQPNDKKEINEILNSPLGSKKGKRNLTADKQVGFIDATIALRDLGLNESRQTNSNIIAQRFQVPNEIYKAFTKGDTFENQKQAQVGFVQNVTKPVADDLASSWTASFGDPNRPIKASFEHLEFMQVVEDQKASKALKISQAIKNLVQSGVSEDNARQLINEIGITI